MNISFNGVIVPYTYNCPYAHKLRNIDKIFRRPKNGEEVVEDKDSRRQFGIDQHELVGKYILGEIDEYEFKTPTIDMARDHPNTLVEKQNYFTIDMTPLESRPDDRNENYISSRPDAIIHEEYKSTLIDWKFGNPEYGATKHFDETEFFLALESSANPEIGEWDILVHFPEHDYTLPVRTYSHVQLSRLQQKYQHLVYFILNRKVFTPKPGRMRCKMCGQRSEDTGGTGGCSYTVI